jgi:hypothetical protein
MAHRAEQLDSAMHLAATATASICVYGGPLLTQARHNG